MRQGEILGVAGVAGNGQRELAEVITGLRKARSGEVNIVVATLTNCSPREIIAAGVSHIPEDRLGMGLIPNLPISDNAILKGYRRPPLSRGPFLDSVSIRNFVQTLIDNFGIATPSQETPIKQLSGGNLQKTLLAREINIGPKLMVAVHPTRGLDVGATESVQKTLLQQRDNGAAILLISEDLDEIFALSDRIAVMYEGRIMGIVNVDSGGCWGDRPDDGRIAAGSGVDRGHLLESRLALHAIRDQNREAAERFRRHSGSSSRWRRSPWR